MLSLSKFGLNEYAENTFLGLLTLITPKYFGFPLRTFFGTLDIYRKQMNPRSTVLGGGVHGKVCWLIA